MHGSALGQHRSSTRPAPGLREKTHVAFILLVENDLFYIRVRTLGHAQLSFGLHTEDIPLLARRSLPSSFKPRKSLSFARAQSQGKEAKREAKQKRYLNTNTHADKNIGHKACSLYITIRFRGGGRFVSMS